MRKWKNGSISRVCEREIKKLDEQKKMQLEYGKKQSLTGAVTQILRVMNLNICDG